MKISITLPSGTVDHLTTQQLQQEAERLGRDELTYMDVVELWCRVQGGNLLEITLLELLLRGRDVSYSLEPHFGPVRPTRIGPKRKEMPLQASNREAWRSTHPTA
jgi:hypothetical protein